MSAARDGDGRSRSGLGSAVADAGGVLEAELDRRLGVAYRATVRAVGLGAISAYRDGGLSRVFSGTAVGARRTVDDG